MMGLPDLDWGNWLYNLGAGFVGGGASAVVSGVTINLMDPGHFNPRTTDFYLIIGAMFLSNGLMSMFFYLKQNPLPSKITRTTTTEKQVMPTEPPTIVTKRVEETVTETVKKPQNIV